jgi:hypothetical protein
MRLLVFKTLSVDFAVNISNRMIDHLMGIILRHPIVGLQCVGIKGRPASTCLRTSAWRAFFLRFGTTEVRTYPPRSRTPITAILSLAPVPVMRRWRTLRCMLRALPPMKVSSASTPPLSRPSILTSDPLCIAKRMR